MYKKESKIFFLKWWDSYQSYVKKVTSTPLEEQSQIFYFRERLFCKFVTFIFPLSLIALIPGVYVAISEENLIIAGFDLFIIISLAFVLLNKKTRILLKKWLSFLLLYSLAIFLMAYLGSMGPGRVYLFAITIFGAFIFPKKIAYWHILINVFISFLFGFLIVFKFYNLPFCKEYTLSSWIAVSANLIFLSWISVLIITYTLEGLDKTLQKEHLSKKKLLDINFERERDFEHLKLLESVITNTNDIVLITKAEPIEYPGPTVIYANNAFTTITGYSSDEIIGKTPRILQGPKTDVNELARLKECLEKWEACEITIINYKKNGEEFWNNISISPVADKNGWFTHWISIEKDVTFNKNSEIQKSMAASEIKKAYEDRNKVLETIGDAFFTVDKNWKITYWNKKAEILIGKKRQETIGKHIKEAYPHENFSKTFEIYKKAVFKNEQQNFEKYYPSLGHWFDVSVYPSLNGLSIYFRDITESKKNVEKIKLSNERFEKVAEATHDIIWDWDISNNLFVRDRGFRIMFGHQFEIENSNLEGTIQHIHPDDMAKVETSLRNVLEDTNQYFWESEYRYANSDQTYSYVLDRGSIIRNSKGKAIRMVGAMSDITKRKEAEKSLEKINLELKLSNDRLIVINQELEQFAFIASHDLQEPLRMISNFLHQLQTKYSNIIDERGLKYIHFAVDSAKRMKSIVSDLLEFSRVGKTENIKESVDLNKLVEDTLFIFQKTIFEKNAKIIYDILPSIECNRNQLALIIQNLIENALKYHRDSAPIIKIDVNEFTNHWQFSVTDNGIGIEKEYFEKIFVIFQRLHSKDEFSGTGIGLAIVQKIVKGLGGKIWVESEIGKGSRFIFTIEK